MRTNQRVFIIAVVTALCLWAIYPPGRSIKLGLDLNGGVHLVLRVKPDAGRQLTPAAQSELVEQAIRTIERRVNELGVSEPVVTRYGNEDQILVQLPGVADVEHAKAIIKSTAQLRLTLVERGPFPDRESALRTYDNALPDDLRLLPGPSAGQDDEPPAFYVVRKAAVVSGSDLRDARQSSDELNRPAVAFTLKQEAGGAVRRIHRASRQPAAGHGPRRPRHLGGDDPLAHRRQRADSRPQPRGDDRADRQLQVRGAARGSRVRRAADDRRQPRRGVDPVRRRCAAAGLVLVILFMLAYYRLTRTECRWCRSS